MLLRRTLNTQTRSMPLEVSSADLLAEWRACCGKEYGDLTTIMEMVDPFLIHWTQMLTDPTYPKDINYVSLSGLVGDGDLIKATKLIRMWVQSVEELSSVYEELQLLMISRLRNFQYVPGTKNSRMAEYVLARDFKLNLRHLIVRNYNRGTLGIDPSPMVEHADSYEMPDWLFVKNLELTPWEHYLLRMLISGLTLEEVSQRYVHIPRPKIFYEEKAIWLKIERMLSEG